MAFRTKRERYAYVKGIKKGMKGGRPYGRREERRNSRSGKKLPAGSVVSFALDDFVYDSRGRIKGSYVDGKFEPE